MSEATPEPWRFYERAADAHDALVAACERFVKNGVCTCIDGGPGFVCDICEARAALALARPQEGKQ